MSNKHEATYGPKQTTIRPWPKPDWCIKIHADDKSELLAILANGTVRGSIENAGPAAQRFVAELRGLTEAIRSDAKVEALREAADWMDGRRGSLSFASVAVELRQRADWMPLRLSADNLEKP